MNIPDLDKSKLRRYLEPGAVTAGQNRRLFDVHLEIRFESNLPAGEWDRGLLHAYLRKRAGEILRAVIEDEYPDWQIAVKVESKYNNGG